MNIRSILGHTLPRNPTEHQWEELEDELRRALAHMPMQTLPEALAAEPAKDRDRRVAQATLARRVR